MFVSLQRVSAFIIVAVCLAHGTAVYAARYVRAQVILDGKVLLEGNASDDGERDADELWEALKSVTFKPTEEFKKLKIDSEAQAALIKSTSPRGELVNLKIYLAYGGTAIRHEFHIKRVPVDAAGREWQLDSDEIDGLFDSRLISRSEAARLADPKRTK